MNIVTLSLFFAIYYGKNTSCLREQLGDKFGPWDTNLRYHVVPPTRNLYGQDIIDTVNRVFKHKVTTVYVFGTPMQKHQKEWLKRCSDSIFPHGVLAWGSNLNFVPTPYSSVISRKKDIADSLNAMYDDNPISEMIMVLPLTNELELLCNNPSFS